MRKCVFSEPRAWPIGHFFPPACLEQVEHDDENTTPGTAGTDISVPGVKRQPFCPQKTFFFEWGKKKLGTAKKKQRQRRCPRTERCPGTLSPKKKEQIFFYNSDFSSLPFPFAFRPGLPPLRGAARPRPPSRAAGARRVPQGLQRPLAPAAEGGAVVVVVCFFFFFFFVVVVVVCLFFFDLFHRFSCPLRLRRQALLARRRRPLPGPPARRGPAPRVLRGHLRPLQQAGRLEGDEGAAKALTKLRRGGVRGWRCAPTSTRGCPAFSEDWGWQSWSTPSWCPGSTRGPRSPARCCSRRQFGRWRSSGLRAAFRGLRMLRLLLLLRRLSAPLLPRPRLLTASASCLPLILLRPLLSTGRGRSLWETTGGTTSLEGEREKVFFFLFWFLSTFGEKKNPDLLTFFSLSLSETKKTKNQLSAAPRDASPGSLAATSAP